MVLAETASIADVAVAVVEAHKLLARQVQLELLHEQVLRSLPSDSLFAWVMPRKENAAAQRLLQLAEPAAAM